MTTNELAEALQAYLLDAIKNGERVPVDDGEVRRPPSAALLGVARALIKDFPPKEAPRVGEIKGALKQFERKLPFSQPTT